MAPEVQAGTVFPPCDGVLKPTGPDTPRGLHYAKNQGQGGREGEGTPNVPSGRRKSPVMEAVLVQANIRQVPAHVRLTNDRVGLTDPGKISAEILTQME